MLLPMIVAMVLQMINKEKLTSTGLLRFKIRWSWLVAWILPVVIVLLTIFVNTLLPGCEFNTDMSAMVPTDSVPEEQKEMVSMLMTPAF
jgi:hypothetical protein